MGESRALGRRQTCVNRFLWQDYSMKECAFTLADPLPELKDPHVIAMLRPWIDVGSVGTIALRKLERYFGAKELGRLSRPGNFYDFTRYRPIMRTVEGNRVLNIPNTIINYAVREEPPDLLFFHLLEPSPSAKTTRTPSSTSWTSWA